MLTHYAYPVCASEAQRRIAEINAQYGSNPCTRHDAVRILVSDHRHIYYEVEGSYGSDRVELRCRDCGATLPVEVRETEHIGGFMPNDIWREIRALVRNA